MSRFRRFTRTLVSSYFQLLVATAYSIISVPLVLHYLSRPEFGLWAVVVQVGGYLVLVELGMSSSVARLLIDHKDAPAGGEYGSLILTGQLVLLVQGGLVAVLGLLASPLLASLLDIQPAFHDSFVMLMRLQALVLGISLAARTVSHLLYAHQRMDLFNLAQTLGLVITLGVLWWGLRAGWGVASVVIGNAVGWLVGMVIQIAACLRLRLLPPSGAWGKPSWTRFRELFAYGRDMFLIALGSQLVMASQTIVITRVMGLDKAAVWAVGSKVFTMSCQLVWRVCDVSVPALAEMWVRSEISRLRQRFCEITTLSISVGVYVAVLLATSNAAFVAIWTSGRIRWSMGDDGLLGLWLVAFALQHCLTGFVAITKEIRWMRFVYLAEGTVFILLAVAGTRLAGITGIIISSILTTAGISGCYGLFRCSGYLDQSPLVLLGTLVRPAGILLLALAPVGVALIWLTQALDPRLQFALRLGVLMPVGGWLLFRCGIPATVRAELVLRAPISWRRQLMRAGGLPAPDYPPPKNPVESP